MGAPHCQLRRARELVAGPGVWGRGHARGYALPTVHRLLIPVGPGAETHGWWRHGHPRGVARGTGLGAGGPGAGWSPVHVGARVHVARLRLQWRVRGVTPTALHCHSCAYQDAGHGADPDPCGATGLGAGGPGGCKPGGGGPCLGAGLGAGCATGCATGCARGRRTGHRGQWRVSLGDTRRGRGTHAQAGITSGG
jgi:hypothetical protein